MATCLSNGHKPLLLLKSWTVEKIDTKNKNRGNQRSNKLLFLWICKRSDWKNCTRPSFRQKNNPGRSFANNFDHCSMGMTTWSYRIPLNRLHSKTRYSCVHRKAVFTLNLRLRQTSRMGSVATSDDVHKAWAVAATCPIVIFNVKFYVGIFNKTLHFFIPCSFRQTGQ